MASSIGKANKDKERKNATPFDGLDESGVKEVKKEAVNITKKKKKQKKEKSSGSAQIWFPHVFHQFLSSDNVVIQNCKMGPPLPKIEQSRMLKADHLRRSLTKMRKVYFDRNIEREMEETGNNDLKSRRKMKPAVMAVERWFMQNGLKFPSSAPENFKRDAVFPMFTNMVSYDSNSEDSNQEELVADLCVAKDREEDAREIAKQLLTLSNRLAVEIQEEISSENSKEFNPATAGVVTLVTHKHTIDVLFTGPNILGMKSEKKRQFLKINPQHLAKLRTQYEAVLGHSIDSLEKEQVFLNRVFCLLARYQTIQGHGFQAAVSEKAFSVLNKDLGVDLEVFASPLNSTFPTFCSAYPDTDACFGSIGSFFDFSPRSGSYECNPPFVLSVMDKMSIHINELFEKSEGPLSFVVVVPRWDDADFYHALHNSIYLKRKIVISKAEHGYCDGAAFQRQDRFRDSPYDTVLFLLQNTDGCVKWTCDDKCEERIRLGFKQGIPTDGMRLRQAKAGRGTADECRGVYKGSKKNRTGEGVMKRKRDELKEKKKIKKQKVKQLIREEKQSQTVV